MRIFVSYSSHDRKKVVALVEDLEGIGHDVWFDQELSGGQRWWDRILSSLRECDLVIFALSPHWLDSFASGLEFDYAAALNKNRLPVLIAEGVEFDLLPTKIQALQIVDYRQADREAIRRLARALTHMPAPAAPPDPLPEPPPAPISPLADIAERLSAISLALEEQTTILHNIERLLDVREEHDHAVALLYRLRTHPDARRDILERVDDLLLRAGAMRSSEPQPAPPPAPPPLAASGPSPAAPARAAAPQAPPRSGRRFGLGALLLVGAAALIGLGAFAIGQLGRGPGADQPQEAAPTDAPVEQVAELPPTATSTPDPLEGVNPTYAAFMEQHGLTVGEDEIAAYKLAEFGMTRNADWAPYIADFSGVKMALVPRGCFTMGSAEGPANEQPAHAVCFERPFWIDVTEVTNAQYGSVGCAEYSSAPDQPRNCVSWVDARAHCEGRGARLPTEAEWEYAARGPDGLTYPWGNEFVSENVVWNISKPGEEAPVGSKPQGISWVGALDLSGNVWEWVADWYQDPYQPDAQADPVGPNSGEYRVLRGGSWVYADPLFLRAALRGWFNPLEEAYNHGFRGARDY